MAWKDVVVSAVMLLLLILAGFVAAPLAVAGDNRLRARVARIVLPGSTTAAVGFAAFGFDHGLMRPYSWMAWGGAVMAGIALCVHIFVARRLRFALVCGAALL